MYRLIIWLIYRLFGKRVGRIVSGVIFLALGFLVLVGGIAFGMTGSSYWISTVLCLGLGALLLVLGIRTAPKNAKPAAYGIQNQMPGAPYGQQPQQPPQAYPYPYGQQPQQAYPYPANNPAVNGYPQQPAPYPPAAPYGQPQYQYPPQQQGAPYPPPAGYQHPRT